MVRPSNLLLSAACALLAGSAAASTPSLGTELVVNGLARPVWLGSPPGDTTRLFVVQQNTATVRIIDLTTNTVKSADYLNILSKVRTSGNEQGLLGMAFDPNYANNRFIYLNYTRVQDGATVVERYQTQLGNPDLGDATSGTIMFGPVAQPFSNHNAGDLEFGLDGYLYIGFGDGGSANDPNCRAQNGQQLLGKMLRVDVSTVPASAPASNPFVGDASVNDFIWALGLRNPWRYGFDRGNGDFYIADVGQNQVEEVDWVPGTSTGGENYGWKIMEGNNCFSTSACPAGIAPCNSPVYTDPVVTYPHSQGCSITGGDVYRGSAIPGLPGTYFYADYCSATIWSFRMVGGVLTEFTNRTAELDPPGTAAINTITTFGYDATGEMYIADQGGEIYRIIAENLAGTGLGFGKAGGNGQVPCLVATGSLATGGNATVSLSGAAANRPTVLLGSVANNPSATIAGTLVPVPPQVSVVLFTNGAGEINIPVSGGGGPLTFNIQYAIDDPGAVLGAASSNAFALDIGP